MSVKSAIRTSLWRFSGPAVSFMGQVFVVSLSPDLQYQRGVFFILMAQMFVNSTEYPYFIAARKKQPCRIHPAYVPGCVLALVAAWLVGVVPGTGELAYCLALHLALACFSVIYTTELTGGIARTTAMGVLRNTVITALLVFYVMKFTRLTALAALAMALVLVSRVWSERSKPRSVPRLTVSETIYSLLAAVLVGAFYAVDRYLMVRTFPDAVRLVNATFVAISVILLLSNVTAVHFSTRAIINNVTHYVRNQFILVAAISLFAGLLWLSHIKALLVCFSLLATPVVFSLQSAFLLGIQERHSPASTAIAYLIVLGAKGGLFLALVVVRKTAMMVSMVPLLGLFTPLLIVWLARRSIGQPLAELNRTIRG